MSQLGGGRGHPSRDQKPPAPGGAWRGWQSRAHGWPAFCAYACKHVSAAPHLSAHVCLHMHVHTHLWGLQQPPNRAGLSLPDTQGEGQERRDKSQSHHIIKPRGCPPWGRDRGQPHALRGPGERTGQGALASMTGHAHLSRVATDPTAPCGGPTWYPGKGADGSPWLPRGLVALPRPARRGRYSRGLPGTGLGVDAAGCGGQHSPVPGHAELGHRQNPESREGEAGFHWHCARSLWRGGTVGDPVVDIWCGALSGELWEV